MIRVDVRAPVLEEAWSFGEFAAVFAYGSVLDVLEIVELGVIIHFILLIVKNKKTKLRLIIITWPLYSQTYLFD